MYTQYKSCSLWDHTLNENNIKTHTNSFTAVAQYNTILRDTTNLMSTCSQFKNLIFQCLVKSTTDNSVYF